MVRVRFAPSPTGFLHVGGARTALFNYLFAKCEGGSFIVRVDDTDKERSKDEFEEDILDSMRWLGLNWDEGPGLDGDFGPYRQSERLEQHLAAADKLLSSDRAYRDSEGVVRLRYTSPEVVVKDLVCGDCVFSTEALGPEPVILRSNGTPTYHLASVSDDIEMKISHIIRGQDHLTNTAKHLLIFEALEAPVPKFAHLPLILGEDRSKLSKRDTDALVTVREFREQGYLAEALNNFLLLLGWSHPEEKEQLSLEEAAEVFSLDRINQTAAVFELNKLSWLNGWWIRNLSARRIAEESLPFVGDYRNLIEEVGMEHWSKALSSVQSDIADLKDVHRIATFIFALEIEISEAAREQFGNGEAKESFETVVNAWQSLLNDTPLEDGRDCYTSEQFQKMQSHLKKNLDVSKKELFQSTRVAIMGDLRGPDLKALVSYTRRDLLLSRAAAVLDTI